MKSRSIWSHVAVSLSVLAFVALSGCSIQLGGCNQAKYERTESRQAAVRSGQHYRRRHVLRVHRHHRDRQQ